MEILDIYPYPISEFEKGYISISYIRLLDILYIRATVYPSQACAEVTRVNLQVTPKKVRSSEAVISKFPFDVKNNVTLVHFYKKVVYKKVSLKLAKN